MAELDHRVTDTLDSLIQALEASERRLYNAAEHVRNRGLKLVLKSYVQQRTRAADELRRLLAVVGAKPAAESSPAGVLTRGWRDVKATMTVKRQSRQNLVLQEVAQEEAALLNDFATALKSGLPSGVQELVQRQHDTLRAIHRRLTMLAAEQDYRVLVRLFNDDSRADSAVQQLQRAGFAADDIYTTAVDDIAVYADNIPEERRSLRDAATTTVLLGALAGAVLGFLLSLAHRFYFPEVPGVFAATPAGVMVELLLGGLLIGALFGLIFGLLMGRDAVEDDAYLYAESLQHGDTLVAVFTDRGRAGAAERIIGLRHQFEVEPATT